MATATAYQSYMALPPEERLKKVQAATGAVPKTATPTTSTPTSGMSATAAGATAQPMGSMPAYGSNIANFNPNDPTNVALADAGQQYATAKQSGNTAGMSAAKALGQQIRSGVQGASYDSVKGISTLPTATPQPPQVSMPPQPIAQPFGQLTPNQINTEAQYTINKERSDLQTSADKASTSLRDNAAYANKLLNDSRTLGDFSRTQTADPFKNLGRTSFNEGLIGRQRSIDDTHLAAGLTNELNAVQQDLYNFDKLAPDKQRALINEMTRIERQYGLEVGQLMGEFNGERTLAGEAQDFAQSPNNPQNVGQNISNQINQLNLDNLPEEIRLGFDALKQDIATGKLNQQEAEIKLKELQDPNSVTNQLSAFELQIKQMEAANLPETQRLELQKLRKTISDIGVVHYKPQTEAEKEYDQQQVLKIKAEIAKIENGSTEMGDYTTNPVFIGAYADASGGGLTSSEITKDAKSIMDELGKKAYDELLATARSYEKSIESVPEY